jgi:ribonuclease BN (tRNA processing enzyme)
MTEVVFVGTSDAFGAGGRRQAAILARSPSGSVLLDCAPTTGTGLSALRIARDEIDAILVTHFHADHFGGIPQFLLAVVHEDGRRRPLRIAGPPTIEHRVRTASAALGHPFDELKWPFPLTFQELRAGAAVTIGPVTARAFETHHHPEASPHGLAIEAGSRRIVYTGDTGWFETLPAQARGADLFISECTFLDRGFEHHLSHAELLEQRERFECGRIILTHLGGAMAARRGSCAFETADDGLAIRVD